MTRRMLSRTTPGRCALVFPLGLVMACAQKEPPLTAASEAPSTEASSPSAAASAPRLEGPLPLGTVLPQADVKMKNVDGEILTLAERTGEEGTLVIFTCNHCPYAKAWEKRITDIGNTYRGKGFGVVAINPNDPSKYAEDGFLPMQERAKTLGMLFPYVVDATSNVARAYGATKTPEVYLFDAEEKLVYHGAVDDNAQDPEGVEARYLVDALEAVLSGAPVPLAETRAVGCSIKFRPEA